jgi:hypothetical protein
MIRHAIAKERLGDKFILTSYSAAVLQLTDRTLMYLVIIAPMPCLWPATEEKRGAVYFPMIHAKP